MPTKVAKYNKKTLLSVENIVLVLFCILLAYPPFFRGMYFEKELMPTHVLSFALALIWIGSKYKKREYKLIQSPIDITAIGIVFMYFISIFYAVDTRLAIGEMLKYANYFFIFLLARDLSTDEKNKKWMFNTLIISAVGVSIVGIGSYIGTWSYNGAVMGDRIASTFQYPNTLASFLGAIFIIATGLFITEENKENKILYGASSSLLLFTFILTYSRGMWLILPFVLLLYIIAIPNKKKLELIIFLFFNSIISIGFAMVFGQLADSNSFIQWIMSILPAIIMGVISYFIVLINPKINKIKISTNKVLIFILVIVIICGSGILYAFNQIEPLTLSNNSTKDNWITIYRNVGNIEENREYTLSVNYSGENSKEQPYIGRVRVYSLDDKGNLEQLKTEQINKSDENQLQLEFVTTEKTNSIRVYFDNYYSGTSITYDNATVIDTQRDSIIDEIKLKYKYIPESIITRINSININDNSAQGRLTFYRDGLKVIKDYFLLGTGGGGWSRLYTSYQSYGYTSTQAHNYFLQVWIEVGIVGLLILLAMICLLVYYTYKKWHSLKDEKSKISIVTIFITVVLILGHAFMDFDLSLSALTFILWGLMGILAGYIEVKEDKKDGSKVIKVISMIVLVLLLINSSSLVIGNALAQKAVKTSEENNIEEAIEYFDKAILFDPYKTEYRADFATLGKNMYQQTKDKKYINDAFREMDKAQELGKYNPNIKAVGASFYLNIGYIDRALSLVDETVEIQPMIVENYLQKSNAYLSAFKYYLNQKNDKDKAREIINEAYKVKEEIKEINSKAIEPLRYNEDLLYKLGYIQFYKENLDSSEYMIDNNYALNFAYYFDLDIDGDGKIDMLREWNSDGGQIKHKQMEQDESDYIRITNEGERYGMIYPYGLKLEPNTNYSLFIKVKGTIKKDSCEIGITDNNAERTWQARLKEINVDNEWTLLKLDFKTDSDIAPGSQYLRLQHNGNDDGYIDIEEAIVFKEAK
ncbi:O-antigen ligase family protein [Sporosalibacterium faouarense]|uniref:O-antigen ligase family protein n=1 Tax=Sporosalibacterium faouarense TaxID=516123 RepID=UPI00192B5808|nr:O-antigen ligase family protein [Sporosalibacterium faouarense]